jgi:hypothetical protein
MPASSQSVLNGLIGRRSAQLLGAASDQIANENADAQGRDQ